MYPKINDLLVISVDSGDEKETRVEYKSRIADMDEESILIEVPIREGGGQLIKLSVGDELSIYFMTDGGVKNYFNSYVTGFKQDVIRMVKIRKPDPDSIGKIQRRSFLRVSGELEMAVSMDNDRRFLTRTDDIGGGGISFYCEPEHRVAEGDRMSCWVVVPYKNGSLEHVPFEGEIVRIKALDNGRKIVMAKFTTIADIERQKLIRYCFERQLDFRR